LEVIVRPGTIAGIAPNVAGEVNALSDEARVLTRIFVASYRTSQLRLERERMNNPRGRKNGSMAR